MPATSCHNLGSRKVAVCHCQLNFMKVSDMHPERSRSGQLAKIGPYLVGHSKVSRNTLRVSCRPRRQISAVAWHSLIRTSNISPAYVRVLQLDVPKAQRCEALLSLDEIGHFQSNLHSMISYLRQRSTTLTSDGACPCLMMACCRALDTKSWRSVTE